MLGIYIVGGIVVGLFVLLALVSPAFVGKSK